ncbi:MAG: hypothetical protein NVS9B10_05880 [Nevskia sp.]
MKGLTALLLLCGSIAGAHAAVYRCEQGGKLTYTDQPCAAGAEPARLPAVTSVPPDRAAAALAKQYDADAKRNADTLAKSDRDWLKKRGRDKAQEDALRSALVEHRVIKGMTREQVRQVLNTPQGVEDEGGPKERWIYQNGRERRTIAFKGGVVSTDTTRSARK